TSSPIFAIDLPNAAAVPIETRQDRRLARSERGHRRSAGPRSGSRPLTPAHHLAKARLYQMPGISRFVRAEYAKYSAPKPSIIIRSSAPTRSAKRIANAMRFDGPATQFGMTNA